MGTDASSARIWASIDDERLVVGVQGVLPAGPAVLRLGHAGVLDRGVADEWHIVLHNYLFIHELRLSWRQEGPVDPIKTPNGS